MPANLTTLTAAISADPGLRAATSAAETQLGVTATSNLKERLKNLLLSA